MKQYTIYCTRVQAKNALEFGAPVKYSEITDNEGNCLGYNIIELPTAEEMIGWLEERGFEFYIYKPTDKWVVDVVNEEFFTTIECDSRKEAILAAIDEAFDGLDNNDLTK